MAGKQDLFVLSVKFSYKPKKSSLKKCLLKKNKTNILYPFWETGLETVMWSNSGQWKVKRILLREKFPQSLNKEDDG